VKMHFHSEYNNR